MILDINFDGKRHYSFYHFNFTAISFQAGHTLHFGGGYPQNGWPNAHFEKTNSEGFNEEVTNNDINTLYIYFQ